MNKTVKRTVSVAASAAMLLSAMAPFGQEFLTSGILTAFAADHTADMVNNPSKYFEYHFENGYAYIDKYLGTTADTVIRIPGRINGKQVKRVGTGTWRTPFLKNDNVRNCVTSIKFDDYITEIAGYTFNNFSNLQTVTIPYTVTKIESDAFSSCPNLRTVNITSLITNENSIGLRAFSNCPNLTNVNSNAGALTLLYGGAHNLKTISNRNIVTDTGWGNMPNMISDIRYIVMPDYAKLENTYVMKEYERLYAPYFLKAKVGITDNMTNVQKAAKLYRYIKNNVSYDTNEYHAIYDSQGHVIDYGGTYAERNHSIGAVMFDTKTVCDGYAKGLDLLFKTMGFESYYISCDCYEKVYKNGTYVNKTVGHAFNGVKIDDYYYIVDLTGGYSDSFMVSAAKQRQHRTTNAVSAWRFSNYKCDTTYTNITNKMTHELGDVNNDGRANNTDSSIISEYGRASASQRNQIASRYGLSTWKFERIADADANGVFNGSQDSLAVWNRYQAALKFNFT